MQVLHAHFFIEVLRCNHLLAVLHAHTFSHYFLSPYSYSTTCLHSPIEVPGGNLFLGANLRMLSAHLFIEVLEQGGELPARWAPVS